jgi:hypothetical protein
MPSIAHGEIIRIPQPSGQHGLWGGY